MKLFTLTCLLAILALTTGFGQNSVVIGTMVNKPNALLVLNPPGANQGFLLPQLTTASRLSISPSSSEDGLLVFDITEKEFYHWKNNQWVKGLGGSTEDKDSQTLKLDVANQLSISNGNTIDLSQLKEIPSQSGHSGKFITTDGNTLSWASIGNIASLIADGSITTAKLADNAVNASKLADGSVNTSKLADNSVNGSKVIDNTISTADIIDNAITTNKIANNAISSGKIADNSISTSKLADDAITSAKIADNAVIANAIADGAVTTNKLANSGVTTGTYGNATNVSQVTVDSKGRITSAVNVPITGITASGTAGGDLSGTFPSPKVTKIQGNAVSSTVLAAGDNGKIMVWNGTQWNAQTVSGIAPALQYYNLDPSDFRSARNSDKKDHDNGLIFSENTTFITVHKKDEGEMLIAPLHLPDGASIQQILFYYMDKDGARNITLNVYRKTFTGTNESIISSWSSSGSSASIQSATLSPTAGRDVIDNALYTYRLVATLDVTDDSSDASDSDHRVYAVQVKYIK